MPNGQLQGFIPVPGIPQTNVWVRGPIEISHSFNRIDQDGGWNEGAFFPNERLIWSFVDGSFRFDFFDPLTGDYAPVAGVGARYQDSIPGVFNGRLRGYDQFDNLLFSYDLQGETYKGDPLGSAPFFGALGNQRNIAYVYYDDFTTGAGSGQQGFALGTFYVQADPASVNPVPAPSALLSLGIGGLTLAVVRQFRR